MASMSRRKVQTALLLDQPVRDRADILAASMEVVRAEVLRRALEGQGLKGLEREYAEPRGQLIVAAGQLRLTTVELARVMEADRITLTQVLEAMKKGATDYREIRKQGDLSPARRRVSAWVPSARA